MAFCSHCGAYLPEGASSCPSCGAPQYQQPPYYQPSYYQPPVSRMGGFRANIRRRDIAIAIILSIVTFGIYGLVWFFNLISDLNTAIPEPDDKEPGMVLLLTIVTCGIYSWIWLYNAGQKVDKIRAMNGELASNSALLYLLLAIFGLGIVDYCLIQSELNKVAVDAV